jgi:hypothetical protein
MRIASFPLQAYLMTKLITVFSETGQQLVDDTKHWALIFVGLACATGVGYFLVGFCATTLSTVSINPSMPSTSGLVYSIKH